MRYVSEQLSNEESILIPRKGSLNNIFYVDNSFWTVDTLFWTKIDFKKVFAKFLYYQLTEVDFTILNVGSAEKVRGTQYLIPQMGRDKYCVPGIPEFQKSVAL